MAQVKWANGAWQDWVISQIGGEAPPYKINMFKRAGKGSVSTQPISVPVSYKLPNGTFTTGAYVEAQSPADNKWYDAPPTGSGEKLFLSEIVLEVGDLDKLDWSYPVNIDGEEGDEAGIWTIWSTSPLDTPPVPEKADNIIEISTVIPEMVNIINVLIKK